jgi:hypothetical protein
MTRFLPLLGIGLLLLGSCSKKDSEPAPALEGTWDAQTQTVYNYWLDGTAGPQEGPSSQIGQFRAEIGGDSIYYVYTTSTGTYQGSAFVYTRQGNLLTNRINNKEIEIKELSAHLLTLRHRYAYPGRLNPRYSHSDIEYTFTR